MSTKKDQAMSNMKTNFGEFHQELSKFFNTLTTMLQDSAPAELKHVKLLPAVFTPSDPDFSNENFKGIVDKWIRLKDFTERVLAKIGSFVKSQNSQWFSDQKNKLEWWIFVVNMSAMSLTLDNQRYVAEFNPVSAGIGGVNYGAGDARARLETLKRERDITAMLQCLEGT